MKRCRRCSELKPAAEFGRRSVDRSSDGLETWCRACKAADQLARYHRDIEHGRQINRASTARRIDKARAESRRYAAEHKDQKREYDKAYHAAHAEKIARRVADWKTNNRPRLNAALNEQRRSDPTIRLAHNIGVQMRNALRGRKPGAWRDLVGYSVDDLKSHLESLFLPSMSWANYGTAWHIDHKQPISTFDLPRQIRECWALSNLQPLGNIENIRKGGRWNGFDPRTKPRKKTTILAYGARDYPL
jgi:hypothetical protein